VGSLRSSSHLGLGSPSPRPSPPGEGEALEPDRIFIVHRLNPVEENRDTSVRWTLVFMDNSDFRLALTPALSPQERGKLWNPIGFSLSIDLIQSKKTVTLPFGGRWCSWIIVILGSPSPRPSPPGEGEALAPELVFIIV